MTRDQALEYFGGVCALARALGVSTSSVSEWCRRRGEGKPIPDVQQFAIERLSGGRLKVDRDIAKKYERAA